MCSPNEFWLCLHNLADAYDAEGPTFEQRAQHIVEQFQSMPRIAQQQVREQLAHLTVVLPDLYPLVVAAANREEMRPSKAG